MKKQRVDYFFPPKLKEPFRMPLGTYRNLVLHGGRGSGKSYSVALWVAILGAVMPLRILCTREYQNTIKESFHAELKRAIKSCEVLSSVYDVGVDYLRHKNNGTEFIFRGLRHNIDGITSMSGINLVVVEEAESIPHESWRSLIPTIREEKSMFVIIFNPKSRDSWVAENFLVQATQPRSLVVEMNYLDNPYFPDVLDEQRRADELTLDPALYAHIWLGQFYERSDAQVFGDRWRVAEFTPGNDWHGPYFGLDFGYANDPTAGVKAWIHDNTLYIEHEAYQRKLELDHTVDFLRQRLPDVERHVMRADNARPESISYLRRHGLPKVAPCEKGKGSVEDGIEHIKSFKEVVIHPRCKEAVTEFRMYSYKTDRLSGDILPILTDAYDHIIDSLRYSLEPIMKARGRTTTTNISMR